MLKTICVQQSRCVFSVGVKRQIVKSMVFCSFAKVRKHVCTLARGTFAQTQEITGSVFHSLVRGVEACSFKVSLGASLGN